MIGSLMSRMGDAQKLSIPQLQQAIQDGVLPAYVGIPLLQEKIQAQKQAQAAMAMQGQQQQAPIAQQVMQEAEAETGLNQLPSNLPQSYADGGIVAFAGGGLPDDKDEDDELEELFPTASTNEADLIALIAQSAGRKAPSKGVESLKGGESPKYSGKTEAHPFGEQVMEAARKYGLDPNFALKLANIETGNLKNPEKAVSPAGAMGIMQLMPSTARGLGVKDPFNPEENISGGVRLAKRLLDKYDGDFKLAAAAYNWGEGNVDKMLKAGRGFESAPKETQKYVASLAEGGIIGLASGGNPYEGDDRGIWQKAGFKPLSDDGVPQGPDKDAYMAEDFRSDVGNLWNKISDAFSNKKALQREEALKTGPDRAESAREFNRLKNAPTTKDYVVMENPDKPKSDKSLSDSDKKINVNQDLNKPSGNVTSAQNLNTKPVGTTEEADPYVTKLRERLLQQMEDAKAERDTNKYLGLMQAGLAMMGGTSPYAGVNIGQGASAGLNAFANMEAARRKELRDLQAQEIGLYKYEQAAKNAAETRKLNEFFRNKSLDVSTSQHRELMDLKRDESQKADINRYRDDLRTMEQSYINALQKEFNVNDPLFQLGKNKPNSEYSKYLEKLNRFYSSPEYLDVRSKAYPGVNFSSSDKSGSITLDKDTQARLNKYKN